MGEAGTLLFILFTATGVGAVFVIYEVMKRQLIERVRAQWARQAWAVSLDPVGATYYGSQLKRSRTNTNGRFGALGITHGRIMFQHRSSADIFIPLEDIVWAGVHAIRVTQGKSAFNREALIVHSVINGRYDVSAWVLRGPQMRRLLEVLESHIGTRARTFGTFREDHGPAEAVQVQQDIYGQWAEVAPAARDLYLAPDRLVIGLYNFIRLPQIRRVDVYEKDTLLHQLNPFAKDLLRIEYETSEGEHAVTGFLVRDADAWAVQIGRMVRVPVGIHTGRKKK